MKLFNVMILSTIFNFIFINAAFAGGVETIQFINFNSSYNSDQTTFSDQFDSGKKQISIHFQDSVVVGNIVSPVKGFDNSYDLNNNFAGGVETIIHQHNNILVANAESLFDGCLNSGICSIDQPSKVKYVGETDDSVILMIEGMMEPIEIEDAELFKSDIAIDAVYRAEAKTKWTPFNKLPNN